MSVHKLDCTDVHTNYITKPLLQFVPNLFCYKQYLSIEISSAGWFDWDETGGSVLLLKTQQPEYLHLEYHSIII